MHLSRLMKTAEFQFSTDGRAIRFDDVFPAFGRNDRVGIVSRTPGSAHCAAGLLLAALARFYEIRLSESDDFYSYPDFFVFHVDELRGYHGMIDVWPEHKEVLVDANPESIVSAVNDRNITQLLLEDASPAPGVMARETVEALRVRLKTAYTFDPSPVSVATDVFVTSSSAASTTIGQSAEVSRSLLGDEVTEALKAQASQSQAFRSVSADEVLAVLSGYGPSDPNLRMSDSYRSAHALTESDMNRHRYPV
jgi:hypothetical protein